MPIPFHDSEEVERLGAAAFLHVQPGTSGEYLGALFFINARGEPLEFAYNRVELLPSALWRPDDREQAAVRRLAATLFGAATLTPALLLCQASMVGPHLLGPEGQLALEMPVGRIADAAEVVGYTRQEHQESVATADSGGEAWDAHLFWTPGPPTGTAADLFLRLAERGLLLEPFERAAKGLAEVFGRPGRGNE